MHLPTMSPAVERRLFRVFGFLLMALMLGGVTEAHDALNTGIVAVPAAWAPFVPWVITATGLAIAALTPQVLELRRSALGPDSAPAPSAAQIGEAVAAALAQGLVATLAAQTQATAAPAPASVAAEPVAGPLTPPTSAS